MNSWHDLVQKALLGTERQPEVTAGAEQALLADITHQAYRRRAGARPDLRLGGWDSPAPADKRPPCTPEAAALLGANLSSSKTWLIQEWLELARQQGVRPAAHQLPELLEMGRRSRVLRQLVFATLDARGRWLAPQRSEWLYATLDVTDDRSVQAILDSGLAAEQQFVVQQLRLHDPDRARGWIERIWPDANSRLRMLMLDLMGPGLSMSDEPFLEGLLDEESLGVRRRVADLLSRLPESRLAGRMAARARRYLRWVPAQGRTPATIALQPPAQLSESELRDGLAEPVRQGQLNRQGWQLLNFLRATPLWVWTEHFPYPLEEIIAAGLASELDVSLIRGWATAAERQENLAWAEALLFGCPEIVEGRYASASLLQILSPAGREQLTLFYVGQPDDGPAIKRYGRETTALRECKHSWSEPFARRILERFGSYLSDSQQDGLPQLNLQRTLRQMAYHFPPALLPECQQRLLPLVAGQKRWQGPVNGFLRILETRASLYDAFLKEN
ncbi:MAG: hypothetical protein KDE59_02825 [Anaerolineales bacterium]|nr:hypothetical protein [Anaerolineales bacterium]